MIWSGKRRLRRAVRQADAARDMRQFDDAAALYRKALALAPERPGIHIQLGHMLKEAGKLDQAEEHYLAAQRLRPDDADLFLQFGHLYKRAERWGDACAAYRRALDLQPGWHAAEHELNHLLARVTLPRLVADADAADPASADRLQGRSVTELDRLAPALVPRRADEVLVEHGEEIAIRRLGRREATFWGSRTVLRGLEAIRGFCVAGRPIVEAHVVLDGVRIHRGPLKGGYTLATERDPDRVRKYVFNFWIDFSAYPRGLHRIELFFLDATDRREVFREEVVIADPEPEEAYPDSDFLLSLDPADPRSIEEQVRARPSMVRSARRPLFPDGVRDVLVIRTDQLGDMVASVPAILRLREMLPQARIVGLFNLANAALARTLGVLDDIVTIDFPDDKLERRRLMPLDDQEALRDRLSAWNFDIAIDLAQAYESRDLLRLANARFTYGMGGGDWPWLGADFRFHAPDRWTRHDSMPHSAKVLAFVESLGVLLRDNAPIIRRADLDRTMLRSHGIGDGEEYVLMHTGARIGFKLWPHYGELLRILLAETRLKIVVIMEDTRLRDMVGADLLDDPRVTAIVGLLPFDEFDALLSFARLVVANDSGPKHLASLRGTDVVTIFSARVNWTEWGQENVGLIVSRKLPCAGCSLVHDPEECGRDFVCMTDIRPREVYAAMRGYLADAQAVS